MPPAMTPSAIAVIRRAVECTGGEACPIRTDGAAVDITARAARNRKCREIMVLQVSDVCSYLTCYSLANRSCATRLSMQHNKILTLQRVRRTPNPYPIPVQHVRVDHRRTYVRMAEKLLNRPDVVAVLQ